MLAEASQWHRQFDMVTMGSDTLPPFRASVLTLSGHVCAASQANLTPHLHHHLARRRSPSILGYDLAILQVLDQVSAPWCSLSYGCYAYRCCAACRERKRVQMALLTARTQELEDAVRVRDAEISALRRQLAAGRRGHLAPVGGPMPPLTPGKPRETSPGVVLA